MLFSLQNVSQDGGTGAADVLRHPDLCIFHLRAITFSAQLLDHFHYLIHSRRADGMPARFESAAGADGHAPLRVDLVIETEAYALTAFGKSARFEREGRHD